MEKKITKADVLALLERRDVLRKEVNEAQSRLWHLFDGLDIHAPVKLGDIVETDRYSVAHKNKRFKIETMRIEGWKEKISGGNVGLTFEVRGPVLKKDGSLSVFTAHRFYYVKVTEGGEVIADS